MHLFKSFMGIDDVKVCLNFRLSRIQLIILIDLKKKKHFNWRVLISGCDFTASNKKYLIH